MTKFICDKHTIKKDLKSELFSDEQYFELETNQGPIILCKACFAEAAYKAQIEAMKKSPNIKVEKMDFTIVETEET